MTTFEMACWVFGIVMILLNVVTNMRLELARKFIDYQQEQLNQIQLWQGGVDMYVAGRINMAEKPERTPGCP